MVTTIYHTHNNHPPPPSSLPHVFLNSSLRCSSFCGIQALMFEHGSGVEINPNEFLGHFGHQQTQKIQQTPTNHFQFDGSPYVWAWVWCGWRWMKMCSWETLDRRLNSSLRGGGSSLRGSHGWGAQTRHQHISYEIYSISHMRYQHRSNEIPA